MKTLFAFALGVLGCAYLKSPESILGIEKVSIGIERSDKIESKAKNPSKIHESNKKKSHKTVAKWRQEQDDATERLLEN